MTPKQEFVIEDLGTIELSEEEAAAINQKIEEAEQELQEAEAHLTLLKGDL